MTTRLDYRTYSPEAIIGLLRACRTAFPKVVVMEKDTVRLEDEADQDALCGYLELRTKPVTDAQEDAEVAAAADDIAKPGMLFKGAPGYDKLAPYRVVRESVFGEQGLYVFRGYGGPKLLNILPNGGCNYVPDFDDEVTCVLVQHFGSQDDTSPLAEFLRKQIARFAERI